MWDIALGKLIPTVPEEGSYTAESLLQRYAGTGDGIYRYAAREGPNRN